MNHLKRQSAASRPIFAWIAILALLAGTPKSYCREPNASPNEYQIKAAYLFNFGKFLQWQSSRDASNSQPFNICVLGENPFGSSLDRTVAGENIGGRRVFSRKLNTIHDGASCQIIFISPSEESRLKSILSDAKHLNALTVSDIPDFAERGGMVQFVTQDERIRFAVNLGSTHEVGLKLSSDLLKVAIKVIGNDM